MLTIPQAVAIVLFVLFVVGLLGYVLTGPGGVSGSVVVRCRDGHLFTTVWIPGFSFKAIRLGPIRLQYCPVGGHWTAVRYIPENELTDAERVLAAQFHDSDLP
jgi:hypothetical protein